VPCGKEVGDVREIDAMSGDISPAPGDFGRIAARVAPIRPAICQARPMSTAIPSDLVFECPRCAEPVVARFYGPCAPCCAALRLAYESEGRDVEVEEYVPKMNVTPNAVATKD
jgi:hypothetical protein